MTDKALQRKKIIFWACRGLVEEIAMEKNYYMTENIATYCSALVTNYFIGKNFSFNVLYPKTKEEKRKNFLLRKKALNTIKDIYMCKNTHIGKQGRQTTLKNLRQKALTDMYYIIKSHSILQTHEWQEIAVRTPFSQFSQQDDVDDKIIDMLLSVPPRRSPTRKKKSREEHRRPLFPFPTCRTNHPEGVTDEE